MNSQKAVIIDLGGSHTQLLAREVRKNKVYSEIVPCATPLKEIQGRRAQALIINGGPGVVNDDVLSLLDPGILSLGVPVMAIGYGVKALFRNNCITAEQQEGREGIKYNLTLKQLPDGFELLSETPGGNPLSVFSPSLNVIATLGSPEEDDTSKLLEHFLFNIAKMQPSWTPSSFIEQSVERVKSGINASARAVCGLSGGIDSAVCALLVQKAIGDRLTCIFVDHGLMREGEAGQVVDTFRNRYKLNVVAVDAADEFIDRLKGITDPEEKRRVIGEHFIRVFEREANRLEDVEYLVQGTIYPDIVESLSPSGEVIKSHHNVGGLPEKIHLKLIEPVRELFKDEVREVAEIMELPDDIVWRQPFPGPGLGVRILGEVTREKINIVRRANAIVEEEIEKAGLAHTLWQYFAVLPEIRSVGVSGDRRTYAYPVILRAVTSRDAMTAEWFRFPYDLLDHLSRRIVEEVPEVNRVVYDITSKPPSTIEWE